MIPSCSKSDEADCQSTWKSPVKKETPTKTSSSLVSCNLERTGENILARDSVAGSGSSFFGGLAELLTPWQNEERTR